MKKIMPFLWLLLSLAFASCVDTREELEIKADGSGSLSMKTDLSKMLEMLKNFGMDSSLEKNGLNRAYDTTMLLKDYVDTAHDVPADKKALLRDGKVHLTMNMKETIGKFDVNFPFSSAEKLQQLYASLSSSAGGLKGVLEGMGKNIPGNQDNSNDKGMPQVASVYDVVVTNNAYSRKVNQQRYAEFTQAVKLDELKQMGSIFGAMDYTLKVTLPRKIKTVSNSKAVLSDDKKTVTLKTDLMETFQHPELLALEISY